MDQDAPGTGFLGADEAIYPLAPTRTRFALTSHRMILGSELRTSLDVPIAAIRRIEFDIETGRPATLVFVPHDPEHRPQALAMRHPELEATTRAAPARALVGGDEPGGAVTHGVSSRVSIP